MCFNRLIAIADRRNTGLLQETLKVFLPNMAIISWRERHFHNKKQYKKRHLTAWGVEYSMD